MSMNMSSDTAAGTGEWTDMRREDLRARIDDRWAALWSTLESVPEGRRTEPDAVGFWTVKDLVGHIAWWDDFARETGETIIAGQPEPAHDTEAINVRVYAERRDWSWEQAVAEAEAVHARLLELVARMPEVIPAAGVEDIADDCYDHYHEHIADLTAWLARDTGSNA